METKFAWNMKTINHFLLLLILIVWVSALSKETVFFSLKPIYRGGDEWKKKKMYSSFQIYHYFKCSSYSGHSLSQTCKSFDLEGAWERL